MIVKAFRNVVQMAVDTSAWIPWFGRFVKGLFHRLNIISKPPHLSFHIMNEVRVNHLWFSCTLCTRSKAFCYFVISLRFFFFLLLSLHLLVPKNKHINFVWNEKDDKINLLINYFSFKLIKKLYFKSSHWPESELVFFYRLRLIPRPQQRWRVNFFKKYK